MLYIIIIITIIYRYPCTSGNILFYKIIATFENDEKIVSDRFVSIKNEGLFFAVTVDPSAGE